MNDDPQREDHLLQTFVRLVEKGLEISITLSVGGMLISGTLMSNSEYLRLVSEAMRAVQSPELRDALTDGFTRLAESAQNAARARQRAEDTAESLGEELEDDVRSEYIHLRGAEVFLAADVGIPTQGSTLWRGKIAAVDGFIIGSVTPSLRG